MPSGIIENLQLVNTTAYVITIVVGVAGNLWVAWKVGVVLLFDRSSAVPRQILWCILGICCADLLVLGDLILLVHFRLTDQWVFGSIPCKIFYCVEIVNKFVIPLGLVQISRVSYRSVHISRDPKMVGTATVHRIAGASAIVSVIILMCCVAYFADTNTYSVRRKGVAATITVCNFSPPQYYQTVFNLLAFFVGYILTSVAYVYFYVNVPIILTGGDARQTSPGRVSSSRINDVSLARIRRTVTAFVVVYLSCWTPYWALFWILSFVNIVDRWIVVLSTFAHLLPYVSCTAYPVILTAMNTSIRRAHSSIMNSKRRQLSTIRQGAMQAMTAHLGMVHSWMREDQSQNPKRQSVVQISTDTSISL